MSYLSWRKEHEDEVRRIAQSGQIERLPVWQKITENDLTDTVITPVVDKLINADRMRVIEFAVIFGEYLFEQYNVAPADIEFFSQLITKAHMYEIANSAQSLATDLTELFLPFLGDIKPSELLPEEEDDS